jgi:hypothetical protein
MSINLKPTTLKTITRLAYYQIFGGALGLGLLLFNLLGNSSFDFINIIKIIIALVAFTLSMYSGVILERGKYEQGLTYSTINQILQVISFTILGYGFCYTSGITLGFYIDYSSDFLLGLNFNFSQFYFRTKINPQITQVAVNFVPVYLLFLIDKIQKEFELIELFDKKRN